MFERKLELQNIWKVSDLYMIYLTISSKFGIVRVSKFITRQFYTLERIFILIISIVFQMFSINIFLISYFDWEKGYRHHILPYRSISSCFLGAKIHT